MEVPVFISICIPAYKRVAFLERLLDSIVVQTYRDFEVIISDDSPDGGVQELLVNYRGLFPLQYVKNDPAKGTPENWNHGIRLAKGEWIKLMHDDDWFAGPDSLQVFADRATAADNPSFIFCAYENHYENGRKVPVFVPSFRFRRLLANPVSLVSRNIIGPPSVIMHRKNDHLFYDPTLKWLVDIDFYMRFLKEHPPVYIKEILVNVGLGAEQVTADCFGNPNVEIPENFHLLNKTGSAALKHIMVYDAWWRLLRNLNIHSEKAVRAAGYAGQIPEVILAMMTRQKKLPRLFLQKGILSKSCMFLHYIRHYAKIPR